MSDLTSKNSGGNAPLDLAEAIASLARGLRSALEHPEAKSVLAAVVTGLARLAEGVLSRPGLLEGLVDFQRAIPVWMARINVASQRLAAEGWTIPPLQSLQDIVELANALEDGADADDLMRSFYEEANGERVVELCRELPWLAALVPWRGLLEQCVAAFRREGYAIAVPSLFLVFEGAFARAAGQPFGHVKVVARERLAQGVTVDPASELAWDLMWWSSVVSFLDAFFERHEFRHPRPPVTNRNWVLHGRDDPRLWTRLDALRLMNAIGTVAEICD